MMVVTRADSGFGCHERTSCLSGTSYCREHLSLGKFARHLSLALAGHRVRRNTQLDALAYTGRRRRGRLSLYGPISPRQFMDNTARTRGTREECATVQAERIDRVSLKDASA